MKIKYLFTVLIFSISAICAMGQDSLSIMKNAFHLGDDKISLRDTKKLMEGNPLAYDSFSKGVSQRTASKVIAFTGGFLIGWPIGQVIGRSRKEPNWIMAFAGLGGITIAYMIDSASKKKFKQAVDSYNGALNDIGLENEGRFILSIGFTQSGVGLGISF